MKAMILAVMLTATSAHALKWTIHSGSYDPYTCTWSRQICFESYQVADGYTTQKYTYAEDVPSGGYYTKVKVGTKKTWNPTTCRYEYQSVYENQWHTTYKTQYYTGTEKVQKTRTVAGHCTPIVQLQGCYSYAFQGQYVPCRSSSGYKYFKADTAYWTSEGLTYYGSDGNYTGESTMPFGDTLTSQLSDGRGRRRRD